MSTRAKYTSLFPTEMSKIAFYFRLDIGITQCLAIPFFLLEKSDSKVY